MQIEKNHHYYAGVISILTDIALIAKQHPEVAYKLLPVVKRYQEEIKEREAEGWKPFYTQLSNL